MMHAWFSLQGMSRGGWSNVERWNGITLPPTEIFSHALSGFHSFSTKTSLIQKCTVENTNYSMYMTWLICSSSRWEEFHDVEDTDMAFSLKMVLNSLRTGSDPAAFALKSITSMSTDGDTELHTHINHFSAYIELSCWSPVSVLGQTTEIWYCFRSSSETKSGAWLMRSWPLSFAGVFTAQRGRWSSA